MYEDINCLANYICIEKNLESYFIIKNIFDYKSWIVHSNIVTKLEIERIRIK